MTCFRGIKLAPSDIKEEQIEFGKMRPQTIQRHVPNKAASAPLTLCSTSNKILRGDPENCIVIYLWKEKQSLPTQSLNDM